MKDLENHADDSERASGALSSTADGMDPALKAKWIAALRSGEYRQGHGMMRRNGSHCCLGVLCDVSGLGEWVEQSDGAYIYIHGGEDALLMPPPRFSAAVGLGSTAAGPLWKMNDGVEGYDKSTFAQIADYIEANIRERTNA